MTDFIAEVCSNHNGSIDRALALIDKAAAIGCSGVKFQLFRIDSLFAPEALAHPDYKEMLNARREWELPLDWLPMLKARCVEKGIRFGCTPFYVGAVEELLPFVDFYKAASYSLLDLNLIRAIARTGKPIILSTGMAAMDEVLNVLNVIKFTKGSQAPTILHCVSSYPAKLAHCNLVRYMALDRHTQQRTGWSDHSVDPAVIYCFALSLEASPIEFHLDLDGMGQEYNIGHCWLPEQIRPVIETVNRANDLVDKSPSEWYGDNYDLSEQEERLWRADPGDGLRPLMEMRERLR